MSYSIHPRPTITNICLQQQLSQSLLLSSWQRQCCFIAELKFAPWPCGERGGGQMRPFWTAVKWPTCFSLVIFPSFLLSSLILFYFPAGHLFFSLASFASALMPTPNTISVATVTANRCLVPLLERRNAGQEVESTHANLYTNVSRCDSCITPCVSISRLYAKHFKCILHTNAIYTHTQTFSVPTSEERGCVVVPGVTGSFSPQMTNRYNQLSRDPSCCCHIHYSWTNTYIKQSGGHWPPHYTDTHIHVHTHAATQLLHL